MGKLKSIFSFLLCGCLSPALGQNAAAPVTGSPAQAPGRPTDTKEVFPAKPLRYVGESFEEFIRATEDSFAISPRKFDPFGLPQDPDYQPIVPASVQSAAKAAEPVVPFGDVIGRIQINTVMSGEKKFLVGSRSISQGDRFPVNYEGQAIWIEVTEVSARQVAFKNLQTGEVAARRLNILPPGMTPGTDGISAPGMVPAGRQAPLDLTPAGGSPESPSR